MTGARSGAVPLAQYFFLRAAASRAAWKQARLANPSVLTKTRRIRPTTGGIAPHPDQGRNPARFSRPLVASTRKLAAGSCPAADESAVNAESTARDIFAHRLAFR